MLSLRSLMVALMVAMAVAGCATPKRPSTVSPPVVIPESTWRQIDRDIIAVSLDAKKQATHHARDAMQSWRGLVYQRTGTDFIPWFSGYWTRQWLTMKVTWYKLSAGGEKDPTVDRLTNYLQEQYQDRVLEPVARETDPGQIMEQTTKLYIWLLGELLQRIPQRYGVPVDQFNRRLQGIPAIALAPPPAHSASLYQIIHAEPVGTLPAYVALVARIRNVSTSSDAKTWSSDAGLSSVARRTSERLATELVTRGVASSVSVVVGRAVGMMISLGVTGFTLIMREKERSEMEAQFRKSLNLAFDEEWLDLMRNPDTGVLAGVYYISGQIEGSLTNTITLSVRFEPIPREVLLPGEQPLQDGSSGDEDLTDDGNG